MASFESPCENGCRSYTDWVVWSGDQMLGELRGGFGSDTYGAGSWEGRIAYTHGPGIDAPLSFVRHGLNAAAVTIVPHANWRGTYGAGTYKNGSTAGILDLTTVRWPADDLGAYLAPTEPYAEDQPWVGVLIGNIRDANGWLYRRNRYYDPGTGRFTQEDPIGIAGGLNLYALGGGDAVSYTDPYGLCVSQKDKDGKTVETECEKFAAFADRMADRARSDDHFVRILGRYVSGFPNGEATTLNPPASPLAFGSSGFRAELDDGDNHAPRHFTANFVVAYQYGARWPAFGKWLSNRAAFGRER